MEQLVDAATKDPHMSSTSSLRYEFVGRTDVAVVLRRAAQINQPANGSLIVLELKTKRHNSEHFQAMITLFLSTWISHPLKSNVVLTDLGDDNVFYWLGGRTQSVFHCPCHSPGIALGMIKSFLQQEEVIAISEVQPVQVYFALKTLPLHLVMLLCD